MNSEDIKNFFNAVKPRYNTSSHGKIRHYCPIKVKEANVNVDGDVMVTTMDTHCEEELWLFKNGVFKYDMGYDDETVAEAGYAIHADPVAVMEEITKWVVRHQQ
jgi:hypothetical protein